MRPLPVGRQIALARKGLSALVTTEGSLARVQAQVVLEGSRHGEGLGAQVALVRPLARVDADMLLEVGGGGARLGALRALVRPSARVFAYKEG